jgi:hypothetical protein
MKNINALSGKWMPNAPTTLLPAYLRQDAPRKQRLSKMEPYFAQVGWVALTTAGGD